MCFDYGDLNCRALQSAVAIAESIFGARQHLPPAPHLKQLMLVTNLPSREEGSGAFATDVRPSRATQRDGDDAVKEIDANLALARDSRAALRSARDTNCDLNSRS